MTRRPDEPRVTNETRKFHLGIGLWSNCERTRSRPPSEPADVARLRENCFRSVKPGRLIGDQSIRVKPAAWKIEAAFSPLRKSRNFAASGLVEAAVTAKG